MAYERKFMSFNYLLILDIFGGIYKLVIVSKMLEI